MITEVTEETLLFAAEIHSLSWKSSHAAFCDEKFVAQHTVERQRAYLQKELDDGKRLYMLTHEKPVGIVSVKDDMIENLYVLPDEQRNGYGTELLSFAVKQCAGTPCLWILDNNKKAYSLYSKYGFKLTGNKHQLSDVIAEVEMELKLQ